jgi:hypothetical protein
MESKPNKLACYLVADASVLSAVNYLSRQFRRHLPAISKGLRWQDNLPCETIDTHRRRRATRYARAWGKSRPGTPHVCGSLRTSAFPPV